MAGPAISASYTVAVNPAVLSAGGTAFDLLGLGLTANTRIPIGQVYSFPTAQAVADFFGPLTDEAKFANVYFLAFDNKTKTPDALLFAQYPTAPVKAYLRGGVVSGLTLAQLQAITGTVIIVINGKSWTSGSIDLSAAASFSAAATTIQTSLAAYDAVVTGSIAAATASVTGSIAGTTMTVTAVGSGTLVPGQALSGSGVTATTIVSQLTSTESGGAFGGKGTYQVADTQSASSTTIAATAALGIMTVTGVTSGAPAVGQTVSGTGVTTGTAINAFLAATGTGGEGKYIVSISQTASSTTLSCGPALVTYDSVSGAFVITGGTPGATATIDFATGTASTALKFTSATGAVTSQGAGVGVPAANMAAIVAQTQNFATFTTIGFEPSVADKIAFAAWTNAQNDRYAYAMWDTDITVTTNADTASAGYTIVNDDYSGTIPIYEPSDQLAEAMWMGSQAAIDFQRTNGRRNSKFLTQSGLTPGVTDETIAAQLTANGYNYYGANANAANRWNFFAEGSVTGPFTWADSYINQIWFNSELQTALMTLLTSVGSIPYNPAGNALIEAACLDPINAALNFGAIRPNVPLSALQAAEIDAAAGVSISGVVATRGWYLQVKVATPEVRAARGSPPCTLWYNDGGSVNRINLASVLVQ